MYKLDTECIWNCISTWIQDIYIYLNKIHIKLDIAGIRTWIYDIRKPGYNIYVNLNRGYILT